MATSRQATFGNWQPLGPANVGGRTRNIVIQPSNPLVMYAGGATGGVWKTIDGGQTWTTPLSLSATFVIGALAMDPANANTLYAGTGEWFTNFRGSGIYKTIDGGANWTFFAPILGGRTLMKLTGIKPESENNVNVSALNGIFGKLLGAESLWLKNFNFPFGVSIVVVAKKA